ncbi:Uncharacterised protein [Mycobacteroides abscessus subsp. abscessus]|nr:Uncharacterised protein [Mycobacteroides abscessus subsp. abscessus]
MILNGDRLAVEERLGVGGRMLTVGHRYRTEIRTRGTIFVHVSPGDHRDGRCRRTQPVGIRPAVLDAARVCGRAQTGHHLTEPELRALVESTVRDNNFGAPRRDRQGGLLHGRGRGTAAIADLAEELQLSDARRPCHSGLEVGVHRESHQAIDVRRRQPRVIEGVEHRLGCQPELGSTRLLRKVGSPDTGYRAPAR